MRQISIKALAAASLLCAAAPALAQTGGAAPVAAPSGADVGAALDAAITGAHRSPENRGRDAHRHPKETLGFFGLQPNMTVVEIAPGAGWYTEVLAPVLKDQGKLIAAHGDPNGGAYRRRALGGYLLKLAANPDIYGKVEVADFSPAKGILDVAPGSADMVLTFRNVHNWVGAGTAGTAFKLFFDALKPGGVLGVVDHRWPEDRPSDPRSGYLKESEVIRLAEQAGFKLVGRSEINANAKDTKDYPKGVWTLPPTFREGNTDRGRYAAIGESDRMTLKFVKP
ncbi:class I SAM-dependent methyltransferase [Pedomonas mirosovicensis]|uniref:class I SAM-dependent methyltransferase n=1 Tax=Pedomonas mirosovicensis TaxID=2908641 RepID=UPI0021694388|nr:methyltransferase [Pedomonas mirosovicensis]MCH8684249.1 methyltransferase [Pedomonas mirosovicensis]